VKEGNLNSKEEMAKARGERKGRIEIEAARK
jgi:hypothetical protein